MVNATYAGPIRVAWRDAEGSPEVPLRPLHRIVARNPPVGFALLRGLHDWETGRVVSGVRVTPRHFRPGEWARMQEVGYAGGVDEGMWGSMGGGGVSDGEEGGGVWRPPPMPPTTPPPQAKPQPNPPNPPPGIKSFPSSRPTRVTTGRSLGPESPNPNPLPPPPHTAYEGCLRPQTHPPPPPPTKTNTPKGAEEKDDRPEDPIVGTVVHVPYPTRVERGTVRGIHGRKYGAVWVEHPGGTTLYEVARPFLFPTLEEAERYREEARAGKKKPKPPAPTSEETNPPNAIPTTEPTNPTNPTKPPSGPAKMWDPTTGPMRYEGPDRDSMGHNGHGQHT